MTIRYIRTKLSADNALSFAIATTSVARELADMSQCPPARAAASILLGIFQTIQSIQTNKSECYRLARRCLSILTDMKEQLDDRWETAPQALLRNFAKFERTLESIAECMTREAAHKWHKRLLRKTTIEDAIAEYNAELDDAVRSFQIATLINIHYAVSPRSEDFSLKQPRPVYISTDCLAESPKSIYAQDSVHSLSSDTLHSTIDDPEKKSEHIDFVAEASPMSKHETLDAIKRAFPAASPDPEVERILDHRGFRQYHQSQVHLKGRTAFIKSGWWAGSKTAEVDGRNVLVKTYDTSVNKWIRDVKLLQRIHHPNLPQMIGYSSEEVPTPFILLANVQTRLPQALLLNAIENASISECISVLLRFYRDTLDAALYMQDVLQLSDSKLQDYVENATFRVDAEQTVVMGLPPPEVDSIISWRNYGLSHSVRNIYLNLLPGRGLARYPQEVDDTAKKRTETSQLKLNHLTVLARSLLPSEEAAKEANIRVTEMLQDCEEEEASWETINSSKLTLKALRLLAISRNLHNYTWLQNTVPPNKYDVGDIGYIPKGKDWDEFVVLGNMIKDGLLLKNSNVEVEKRTTGSQTAWDGGFIQRHQVQCFNYPDEIYGWTVSIPPGSKQDLQIVHEEFIPSPNIAWKFLLENGRTLSKRYNVPPADLILVTQVGVDQRFSVRDIRVMHQHAPQHLQQVQHHQRPGFHHQHAAFRPQQPFSHSPHTMIHGNYGFIPQQQMMPLVLFLFTSPKKDHIPYWSETPAYIPGNTGNNIRVQCACNVGPFYGFMRYVQLHPEDFE
ncbi:hypothetical protein ABKN59_010782 [Abortiporus biennis]